MSRLDLFIIYAGNGLANIQPILSIIRARFPILLIKKYDVIEHVISHSPQIANLCTVLTKSTAKAIIMQNFIDCVYGCDSVPLEHLRGKCKYLLGIEPEIVVVIVKNESPDEKIYGEGDFTHIQCSKIKECKEEVRNKFNPKDASGDRTEEHVIHGTDYESQTEYLLKYFDLSDVAYFNRRPNSKINAPFHVEPFEKYSVETLDIDKLRTNLVGKEDVQVLDTPHYGYLVGDVDTYNKYCNGLVGSLDWSDHCAENFDKLIKGFNYTLDNYILVTENKGEYWIQDGNHRLAILKNLGYKEIPVIVTNPSPSNRLDFNWWAEKMFAVAYVIIRKTEVWPTYFAGEDLDILTFDPDKVVDITLRFARLCKVSKVMVNHVGAHTHVDFYFNDSPELNYRFDILSSLEDYNAKGNFMWALIGSSIIKNIEDLVIKIPRLDDDLVLRFAEYWFHRSKVKHLEYVKEHVTEGFFSTLKQYIGIELTTEQLTELGH